MRIYLDAMAVIYAVEDVEPFAERIDQRVAAPDIILVVSDLVRLECRVKPIRDQDQALLQAFDDYFARVVGEIVPLSREVIDRATHIRSEYGFKTPDALHLAAAVESGCDLFLSGDRRLRRFTGLPVESLD